MRDYLRTRLPSGEKLHAERKKAGKETQACGNGGKIRALWTAGIPFNIPERRDGGKRSIMSALTRGNAREMPRGADEGGIIGQKAGRLLRLTQRVNLGAPREEIRQQSGKHLWHRVADNWSTKTRYILQKNPPRERSLQEGKDLTLGERGEKERHKC